MKNPDEFIYHLFQSCYDYLWNRWAIGIGTFRFCFVFVLFLDMLLTPGPYPVSINNRIIAYFGTSIILALLFVYHIVGQNSYQKTWIKQIILNNAASKWKNDIIRIIAIILNILGCFIGCYFISSFVEKCFVISVMMLYNMYIYSSIVLVRPRKEIKKKEKMPSNAKLGFNLN